MPAKRIALVYDAIFPYVKGGGEKRFYEVARSLARDGYDVHLYGMQFWDGPAVTTRNGITLHGLCKARPLYHKSGRRSIRQAVIFGLSCFKLAGERFDAVDCCGFPFFSLFTCRLITWAKRKPLYATWHEVWGKAYWYEYLGRLGWIGYRIEKAAARLPDAIIAVSDHTADALRQTLGARKPVYVVENGIHVDHIKQVASSKDTVDVVYVGRLVSYKNVDLILHAVALLKEQKPHIRCLIVGNGPERLGLETLAVELGLSENVRFLDFEEDHDDVVAHMKAAKVFAIPSTREGFGLVAMEANAAGVPVVTVDRPANAIRKLINQRNGVVTELNTAALAKGIKQAIDGAFTPEDCEAAARRYDWAKLAHKLKAIL